MKGMLPFFTSVILIGVIALSAGAQSLLPSTSSVYPGVDGKLVYIADSAGNRIPDFSNAGYRGGGVAIPYIPNKATVWPVPGDNTTNIQAAIDKVSAMPIDASGFRGAVLLKMGTYSLDKPISIKASGVVLRGEGMSDIGTILIGKKGSQRGALIEISAPNANAAQEATKQTITDKYVGVGVKTFNVASAKGYKVGDLILVRRYGNKEWIKELGLDSASAGRYQWKPFTITFDRIITDIKGNTITVDAPIFTAIETRWGGGDIIKYTENRIENVAVENLRGESDYNPTVRQKAYGNMDRGITDKPESRYEGEEYFSDENHYYNLISFTNVKNAWVRNVSALHFARSLVQVSAGSKYVTVQDCGSYEPVSIRMGSRRFTYQMSGQLCLVQRCFSQKGRHSFVVLESESSGNVFLDCTAINPYSTSEPHSHWSSGILYDNVKAPLTARFWKDINIGWGGANVVMWNCEGDFLIQNPPTAKNYSFGHIGTASVIFNAGFQDLSKPRGYIESLDQHVTPRSLYLTQLKDRLGIEAVRNVLPAKGY